MRGLWAPPVPGETLIDDISGLRISRIRTRAQLGEFEARSIAKALFKYNRPRLSRRSAEFDVPWRLRLHQEMFGEVWRRAGTARTGDLNLGVRFSMIVEQLQGLMDDLEYWGANSLDFVEHRARLQSSSRQDPPLSQRQRPLVALALQYLAPAQ